MNWVIQAEKPTGHALCALYDGCGWTGNDPATLDASIEAYPCIFTARTEDGTLIGYLSAFSDTVLTTMIGELVVHPMFHRAGIGSALLRQLHERYPNTSVHATVLPVAKDFFRANGFVEPTIGMSAMVRKVEVV